MNKKIEKFIKKETDERSRYEELQCGSGISYTSLSIEEANLVDEAIRIYKLPFEISGKRDTVLDCETEEVISLEDSLSYIYEAILCDKGELLDEYMGLKNQRALYKLLIWA